MGGAAQCRAKLGGNAREWSWLRRNDSISSDQVGLRLGVDLLRRRRRSRAPGPPRTRPIHSDASMAAATSLSNSSVVERRLVVSSRNPEDLRRLRRQRQRCLGVGVGRQVVRRRRPQAHRRQPDLTARLLENGEDPGRPLVGGVEQLVAVDQRRVGGHPDDRHGSGVGHLAGEGAEQHHRLDVDLGEHLGQVSGVGAPPEAGLLAEHHHQVAVGVAHTRRRRTG